MNTRARVWLTGIAVSVLGWTLTASYGSSTAGDPEMVEAVQKIAKALRTGDKAGAAKMAAEVAKKIDDIEEVMNVFKPRSKKGSGVGSKPGAIQPDGIELKLNDLARNGLSGPAMKKEAEALEEAGYMAAAIAEVALVKGWPKDMGKKTKKAWADMSKEMREAAVKFAEVAKAQGGSEIKAAATKLNDTCARCHAIFKP